jgi:hypothetical protein
MLFLQQWRQSSVKEDWWRGRHDRHSSFHSQQVSCWHKINFSQLLLWAEVLNDPPNQASEQSSSIVAERRLSDKKNYLQQQ